MKTLIQSAARQRNAKKDSHRNGFTLIELLIVVTIILVLALVVFAMSKRGLQAARAATCASNLKQVGAAMVSYATDNNGELPPLEGAMDPSDDLRRGIWTQIIAEGGYLDRVPNKKNVLSCGAGVWACPECTVVETDYNGYGVAEGSVMKRKGSADPSSRSLRLNEITKPDRTWLVGDVVKAAKDLKSGDYAFPGDAASWAGSSPGARHSGKVNVCMVDGHVEVLAIKTIKDRKITLNEPSP